MNQKEIIQYLKDNQRMGISFGFMPEEVREWVKHKSSDIFKIYKGDTGFEFDVKIKTADDWYSIGNEHYIINNIDVIALPENYQITDGEWEIFNIKDGNFYEPQRGVFYAWHEWSKFMSDNPCYTNFGGWKYKEENGTLWFTTPQVYDNVGKKLATWSCVDVDAYKPATPIEIRFWKDYNK